MTAGGPSDKADGHLRCDVLFNQCMVVPQSSDYRFAPLLVARFVGAYLVLLAMVVFVATALVAVLGLSGDLLVVLLAVGLAGLFTLAWWLRSRAVVVRFDEQGYEVRLIRGAGVKQAQWKGVEEAVTSFPRDLPSMVLRLRDGGTTTIPVDALAVDRDEFARDVQERLQQGHARRRPSVDPG